MPMSQAQLERVRTRGIRGPDPSERRYPFPIPNGWFAVAQSNDLAPGETRNAHYFGRDLVIWREQDTGIPHVVDAYCAHLGAHMGVGSGAPESHEPGPGIVHGACLQCPFHGWRYDGTGAAVEIPYALTDRVPAKARVRGYPTIERNGIIQAWYHALDEAPLWDIPEVPEMSDPDWVGPIYTERYISVALQEMAENDVDTVHFKYVHGTDTIPEQESVFEGRVKRTTQVFPDGGGEFTRETHQLGFGVLRITGVMAFIAASSPLDEAHTHQRWVFAYPKSIGDEVGQMVVDGFSKAGIYQDIPIWEHKQYRERPVLVKGDGMIMEFRRWAEQFYTVPRSRPRKDGR